MSYPKLFWHGLVRLSEEMIKECFCWNFKWIAHFKYAECGFESDTF